MDDCDETTLLCAPGRATTVRTCQNVSLVLQGDALGRIFVDASCRVHVHAHADAVRDRIETHDAAPVLLFAIEEGPPSATFE